MPAPDAHDHTPPATAGVAQSRLGAPQPGAEAARAAPVATRTGPGFVTSERLQWTSAGGAYERKAGEPLYRPLRILALDPAAARGDGARALVNVPFEPLAPGPRGALFEMIDEGADGARPEPLDLEAQTLLMEHGLTPSPTDDGFRAQMAYAVCSTTYAAFRQALGRDIAWGFARRGRAEPARLRVRTCVDGLDNAYYDPHRGELCFGAYRAAPQVTGRNLPGQPVFTVLNHDVVVHETAHALLDGLRARFTIPSNPDVLAFHEAFADLVAIFQRFTYRDVVRSALRKGRGDLSEPGILSELGRQVGDTLGRRSALRSALAGAQRKYGDSDEPHARGEVLVSAVFAAFCDVYGARKEGFVRLASHGTGVLPPGEIPELLLDFLTHLACKLAGHFLSICIRAIDYCPPVDLTFGEYLRAVITADAELVPEDTWSYREALIDAFRAREIYPSDVASLSEDSLLWREPEQMVPPAPELGFSRLQFAGEPARPSSPEELLRRGRALGALVSDPRHLATFGLAAPDDPALAGDQVDLPVVESVRTARRVGPQGQIVFDLVAEVTQRRLARANDRPGFAFFSGATVVLDAHGSVRYVIRKSVLHRERLAGQRAYLARANAAWTHGARGMLVPRSQPFRLLHTASERSP